jgi:hypothetical protein
MTAGAATMTADSGAMLPYAPGWTDMAIAWIRTRPWPAWLSYGVLISFGIIASNAQNWLSGQPFGFTFLQTAWGIVTVGFLAALDVLNRVAADAFDAFRPALGSASVDQVRARYELTTVPRRISLVILAASGPFTAAYFVADPVASQVEGLSPVALAGRWLFESFFTALLLILVVQGLRQLRLVSRLHAAATNIDLFHPAPLHAFSRLTSLTGLALLSVIIGGTILNRALLSADNFVLFWLPWLILFPGIALLVFIVPLLGMHGRLVRIKATLQSEAEDRVKLVLAALHGDIDRLDLSRADGLQKTLGSLVQERDILAKLPTWPWSTGTIRGFASALVLPLGIFLLQRYVGGFLAP